MIQDLKRLIYETVRERKKMAYEGMRDAVC